MAQKIVVQLADDVSGGDAAETVAFGVDGQTYEIDLNEANATALRESLARYVDAARKVPRQTSRRPAPPARTSPSVGYDSKAVRVWAAANGIEVSPRGRIAADVIERYHTAGN